jgi:hypothetical protein
MVKEMKAYPFVKATYAPDTAPAELFATDRLSRKVA